MKVNPRLPQAYTLFHGGTLALAKAERNGIRLDGEYCDRMTEELSVMIEDIEKELYQTAFIKEWKKINGLSFNMYSSDQMSYYLYKVLEIPIQKKTETGKGSTDNEALTMLDIPELKRFLRIKKLMKIRDTYLKGFTRECVEGFIHPFYNISHIVTYRSGSSSPNFQNIPKRDEEAQKIIRQSLFPRKGYQLVEVDYSGVEVRIGAAYHKDPQMIKYIMDSTTDMHGDMAVEIFFLDFMDKTNKYKKELRNMSKGFIFSQFYGDYYIQCTENLAKACHLPKGMWKSGMGILVDRERHISDHFMENGIFCYQEFENHIKKIEDDFWNVRFKVYNEWKKKMWARYQKTGYVDMKTGFRCSGVTQKNKILNAPIQGSAFHCLLWSFVQLTELAEKENWKTRLIGQIHDAIVMDVHPDELTYVLKISKKVMCDDLRKHFKWINVPMDIEADVAPVDGSWYKVEGMKI